MTAAERQANHGGGRGLCQDEPGHQTDLRYRNGAAPTGPAPSPLPAWSGCAHGSPPGRRPPRAWTHGGCARQTCVTYERNAGCPEPSVRPGPSRGRTGAPGLLGGIVSPAQRLPQRRAVGGSPAAGLLVAWRGSGWPVMSSRYTRRAEPDRQAPADSAALWEALSRGNDPTEQAGRAGQAAGGTGPD